MRYYSKGFTTGRNYGSDAIRRMLAQHNAKYALLVLGPDESGRYHVTLDNKDLLIVSNTETTSDGFALNSRSAIKAWLGHAFTDNRMHRLQMEIVANASQSLASEIDALVFTPVS